MADKNSFVLYTDYAEHLELLADDERGRLFMAIFEYADTGNAPDLEGAEKIAFSFIRAQMDRDNTKWEQTRQQRADAGKQGGLAKASRAKQTLANPSKAKQKLANVAVTVPVTDNVTDNVTETPTPPTPPPGEAPDGAVVVVVRAWDKITGKITTMHDSERLLELLDTHGEDKLLQAIRIAGDNAKPTIAYLEGIFRNEGKPPQSRGQPPKKAAENTTDTWLDHHEPKTWLDPSVRS